MKESSACWCHANIVSDLVPQSSSQEKAGVHTLTYIYLKKMRAFLFVKTYLQILL